MLSKSIRFLREGEGIDLSDILSHIMLHKICKNINANILRNTIIALIMLLNKRKMGFSCI